MTTHTYLHTTEFTETYPLPTKSATSVAKTFVDEFILRYGIPREIATDNDA